MPPTLSTCGIKVAGDVVNSNPSYPIDAAADVINTSPSHTYLYNNSTTDIINAGSINLADGVVNTNPGYIDNEAGDVINISSSHTHLSNNPPTDAVNTTSGCFIADEMKDVVNLASENTIMNLHESSRDINTHLVKFNMCILGELELVETKCVALASTIQLYCNVCDVQEHRVKYRYQYLAREIKGVASVNESKKMKRKLQ